MAPSRSAWRRLIPKETFGDEAHRIDEARPARDSSSAEAIRLYGRGNWRKLKGKATVRLEEGTLIRGNGSFQSNCHSELKRRS
jgi:hypothetical protein